jgi:hypothetical protein
MRSSNTSPRDRLRGYVLAAALATIASLGTISSAAPPSADSDASHKMREQMAAMHEQAAACLRSDKPMSACRSEMMQSCQKMMGGQCKMMTGMQMGNGRHMSDCGMQPHKMQRSTSDSGHR